MTLMYLTCPECGKGFARMQSAQKFCSQECYMMAHHPGMVRTRTVMCLQCGTLFQTKRASKYCSTICKDRYYNVKYDKAGKIRARRAAAKLNQIPGETSS